MGTEPFADLGGGVRILNLRKPGQLCGQVQSGAFIQCQRAFHERCVHPDAPVVDPLIHLVFLPYFIRHRVVGQPLLNAHFRFHIADVVGHELFPLLRIRGRRIPGLQAVQQIGFTGLAEVADQGFAGFQLLPVQPQHRAGSGQRHGQPQVRRPDHGAAPANGRKVFALLQVAIIPQKSGEADPFKGSVEGPLLQIAVINQQHIHQSGREWIAGGKIHHFHRTAVYGISDQQHPEIRGFRIAVDAGFCKFHRGIGLDIQGEAEGRRPFAGLHPLPFLS